MFCPLNVLYYAVSEFMKQLYNSLRMQHARKRFYMFVIKCFMAVITDY